MVFAIIHEHAEHCDFFASTSRNKKFNAKIWGARQASTCLNFASKLSKGKILRAVKNFDGPFITPYTCAQLSSLSVKKKNVSFILYYD